MPRAAFQPWAQASRAPAIATRDASASGVLAESVCMLTARNGPVPLAPCR